MTEGRECETPRGGRVGNQRSAPPWHVPVADELQRRPESVVVSERGVGSVARADVRLGGIARQRLWRIQHGYESALQNYEALPKTVPNEIAVPLRPPDGLVRGRASSEVAGAGLGPSPLTLQSRSYRVAETRDLA
jgi:hypothetical protein